MIKILEDLKKNKPLLTRLALALLGALLVLVIFFVIKPQAVNIARLFSEKAKMALEIKAAEGAISKIDKFKKDIETYKDKVDSYENRLPAEKEIPALLEDLSAMAKRSNITILGISPITPAEFGAKENIDQIYQEVPILISAKSCYHELGNFLSNLENAGRFMKVVDIEIKSNKAAPKKHDTELIVCTYILLKGK